MSRALRSTSLRPISAAAFTRIKDIAAVFLKGGLREGEVGRHSQSVRQEGTSTHVKVRK
jgi:hypothetical protein